MQSAQPGERGELGLPRGRLARGAGSKDLTSLPSTLVVRAGSCSDLSWLGDAGGPGQTGSGRNPAFFSEQCHPPSQGQQEVGQGADSSAETSWLLPALPWPSMFGYIPQPPRQSFVICEAGIELGTLCAFSILSWSDS